MKAVEVKPSMTLLPPRPDVCQTCAVDHQAHEAHNAQSIYYAVGFLMKYGRDATWADAVAHCAEAVRAIWRKALEDRKAWTEPPAGVAPIALGCGGFEDRGPTHG